MRDGHDGVSCRSHRRLPCGVVRAGSACLRLSATADVSPRSPPRYAPWQSGKKQTSQTSDRFGRFVGDGKVTVTAKQEKAEDDREAQHQAGRVHVDSTCGIRIVKMVRWRSPFPISNAAIRTSTGRKEDEVDDLCLTLTLTEGKSAE